VVENLVEERTEPLLVVILGPTGSGKTSLSVALGQRFDGEIVSCDSVAVYRGLEIGSAKPSVGQRALVRHHLIDVVDPDAFYTAGDYSRDARAAIADISGRGKLPAPSDRQLCAIACSARQTPRAPSLCTGSSTGSTRLRPPASTPTIFPK
jgi:IPP transferase